MNDSPMQRASDSPSSDCRRSVSRRGFLVGTGALLGGALAARALWRHQERFQRAEVFVARADSYDADLAKIVRGGLEELGFSRSDVRGKTVLLKPNLVEPTLEAPHVNTHPALVRAVAEVLRRWDAREVVVGEAPGHCRDAYLVLDQSGLGTILDEDRIAFADLNHDDLAKRSNRLGFTGLSDFYLPGTLERADLVVSLPKMKTHHWAGVTLSMKNLFGVLPGIYYGWPKNLLHTVGIAQSILDITATVKPHLAIVDGIVGMEGDGPIMGTPKAAGVLVMGRNLPAVDATAARLMQIDPWRVSYLAAASGRLGPVAESHIHQRGEPLDGLAQRFELIDAVARELRG